MTNFLYLNYYSEIEKYDEKSGQIINPRSVSPSKYKKNKFRIGDVEYNIEWGDDIRTLHNTICVKFPSATNKPGLFIFFY
jgi:hypothetical protein